jgi:hypothetical protein
VRNFLTLAVFWFTKKTKQTSSRSRSLYQSAFCFFCGSIFSLRFMIRSRSWDQSLDSAPLDRLSTSKSTSKFYDPLRYSNFFDLSFCKWSAFRCVYKINFIRCKQPARKRLHFASKLSRTPQLSRRFAPAILHMLLIHQLRVIFIFFASPFLPESLS